MCSFSSFLVRRRSPNGRWRALGCAVAALSLLLGATSAQAQENDAGVVDAEAPAADGAEPLPEDASAGDDDASVEAAGDGGETRGDAGSADSAVPDAADPGAPVGVLPAPVVQEAAPNAASAPSAEASPPPAAPAVEVTVRAKRSEAQRLQESAEAVNVIDMKRARQQTADLGEVLARTQGVGVRREGGLGSDATISLNGLQGDQVRLFMDGVPLELAGYPLGGRRGGLANIPVNLVERLEVYRGVVPIRFGADALGGAINVVTDQKYETHLNASYQTGSFGTHRATLQGRYRDPRTGFVAGVTGVIDSARNDFLMKNRELATPEGATIVKDLPRFHDAYRAYAGNAELGVVDQRWARRLLVQGFASTYDKQLQHNSVMSLPYGEITYGETIYGATARYEVDILRNLELELVANYTNRTIDFRDMGTHKYDWTGERGMVVGRNGARGELLLGPIDESIYENGLFGRAVLAWTFVPGQILRVSAVPRATYRIGDDHVKNRPDLLKLEQEAVQFVGGLEYELNLFDDRLSNVVFGKVYYHDSDAEERRETGGEIYVTHRQTRKLGGGDALRFRFTPWLLGKVSYEYATRLPKPDELFGDGVLVDSASDLRPEISHNVNVGPRLELKRTTYGDFMVDVNWFLRDSKDMIILLAGKQFIPYANLADARGHGIENALSWVSPGRWVGLDGAFSWQDIRNTSTDGPFEPQKGMRIPSRPYMFASWGGRVHIPKLPGADDSLEPFYYGRYVHGFDRGWDLGNPEFKQSMPSQVSHNLGVTYMYTHRFGKLGGTFEISNLTDANLFDVFGVQRPGRAYYLKLTGQI